MFVDIVIMTSKYTTYSNTINKLRKIKITIIQSPRLLQYLFMTHFSILIILHLYLCWSSLWWLLWSHQDEVVACRFYCWLMKHLYHIFIWFLPFQDYWIILHTFFSIFFGLLTTIALGRVQAHCDHFLEISIFHFLLSNFSVFFLPISGSWRVSSSLKFISSHSFSNRDLWYTILDLEES